MSHLKNIHQDQKKQKEQTQTLSVVQSVPNLKTAVSFSFIKILENATKVKE